MILPSKRCPARFAFLLEGPVRRWLLKPDRLVATLRLPPAASVLDLGAGSGVVAAVVAPQVRDGRLVLFDAQPRMLQRARRRLATPAGVRPPAFAVGLAEFLPFAAASFDIVLMVTVLGELDDARRTMREVHRVLRPGGLLSITEHLPDPDFRSLATVRALVTASGFAERDVCGGRWSYTINATRLTPFAA